MNPLDVDPFAGIQPQVAEQPVAEKLDQLITLVSSVNLTLSQMNSRLTLLEQQVSILSADREKEIKIPIFTTQVPSNQTPIVVWLGKIHQSENRKQIVAELNRRIKLCLNENIPFIELIAAVNENSNGGVGKKCVALRVSYTNKNKLHKLCLLKAYGEPLSEISSFVRDSYVYMDSFLMSLEQDLRKNKSKGPIMMMLDNILAKATREGSEDHLYTEITK